MPLCVLHLAGPTAYHPKRIIEAAVAAAGPLMPLNGLAFAIASANAVQKLLNISAFGIQPFHKAMHQYLIGSVINIGPGSTPVPANAKSKRSDRPATEMPSLTITATEIRPKTNPMVHRPTPKVPLGPGGHIDPI